MQALRPNEKRDEPEKSGKQAHRELPDGVRQWYVFALLAGERAR